MNCLIVDDDDLSRRVARNYASKVPFLNVVGECEDGKQLIDYLERSEVDLILLDIEMPEFTGIDFLRNYDSTPQVILFTSRKDFALEAYNYNVTDYLLKPISFDRFRKALEKAYEVYKKDVENEDNTVYLKDGSKLVSLNKNELVRVEASSDYVMIYTLNRRFTILATLKSIEDKLPENEFVRVHRSHIVRLDKIKEIKSNKVYLADVELPIGRSYKENLMGQLKVI